MGQMNTSYLEKNKLENLNTLKTLKLFCASMSIWSKIKQDHTSKPIHKNQTAD